MNKHTRDVFAFLLSQMETAELVILEDGLIKDDPDLIQGDTVKPIQYADDLEDLDAQAGCLLSYGHLKSKRCKVEEVNERFACMAVAANMYRAELGAIRHLTNWWDETDRAEARSEALDMVTAEISQRRQQQSN